VKELPIANCQLPIENGIEQWSKLAIGNRQLAMT
jgi:hypothetical protein